MTEEIDNEADDMGGLEELQNSVKEMLEHVPVLRRSLHKLDSKGLVAFRKQVGQNIATTLNAFPVIDAFEGEIERKIKLEVLEIRYQLDRDLLAYIDTLLASPN